MNPSIIPPGFLSTGVTASALLAGALGAFSGHPGYLCIALAIGAAVAINRGWTEAWKAARGVASKAAVVTMALIVLAQPARAGGPNVTARAPMPADIPAASQPAPDVSDAARVQAALAAFAAGLVSAQNGIANTPILKPWSETKAGQIVLGCVAGAIVATSAGATTAGMLAAWPR